MRIDALTVVLRPRSSWEAVELGTALVRRHARAVWAPWFACTLPAFVVANALAWLAGMPGLAMLAMWWLRPVFDRIPLFVLSRAVFGDVPSTRATLRGAFRGAGRAMLGYLTWRRLGPARALLLPIDVLEGASASGAAHRRRVLGGPAYGIASLCLLLFATFEGALAVGLAALALLFVPNEYLPDAMTDAWQHLRDSPGWVQLCENALAWAATSVIEPFYVGSGFGQYLNRRTEIEGWDIELAFRRLRARLLAAGATTALLAALLLVPRPSFAATPVFVPARSSALRAVEPPDAAAARGAAPIERQAEIRTRIDSARARIADATAKKRDAELRGLFASDYRDPSRFAGAVDRAFADPRLRPRQKVTTWEPRDPTPERQRATGANRWFEALGRVLALLGEIGLWLLLGALALLLAFTAKHWWPWLRSVGTEPSAPSAPVVDAVAVDVAPLPADIVAAARALWRDAQPRDALALVYRAAVEAMLASTGRVLPPGATEAQCLSASQALPDASRGAFARVVRQWQYAAWAERLPEQAEFDAALDAAAACFGWRT
jgi:hypothetical protein